MDTMDSQGNENTCVVCFKDVVFYSIGECDHPVCYECSTRMRVLCLQNECPICRKDLSRVVFTASILPYKELRNQVFTDKLFERQFKIGFSNHEIKEAYEELLQNRCKLCENLQPFRSFGALSDHMRKVHEQFYCDLCVKHLRIFTSERRCYNRQELAHHRRKGDVDDTSHRGHPLCQFCEERFMDADELYKHLRKEHLYCHLCDADGRNEYYPNHNALANHFRSEHYLCEEGECAGQHLTAVFRSEIDLIAHKASVHGKGLARSAARQARTLELQFNITPHPGVQRTQRVLVSESLEPTPPPPPAPVDTDSVRHFPRLSAVPAAPTLIPTSVKHTYKGPDGLTRNDRNFPTLGGGPSKAPSSGGPSKPQQPVAATVLRNNKPSLSIQVHSQPASASNFRLTQPTGNRISIPPQKKPAMCDDDFPSLGFGKDDYPSLGAGTVQPPKVTMINSQDMQAMKNNNQNQKSKRQDLNSEAFPALSSTSAPAAPPQWIKVSKSKEKVKNKPEPPPQPKEPSFNAVADFPTLPVNNKKQKKLTITQAPKPQTRTPPQPKPQPAPSSQSDNMIKVTSKKEKKKQNIIKKENLPEDNYLNYNDKRNLRDAASILANVNNNPTIEYKEDKKIKTIDTQPATSIAEKNRNGGNGDFALKKQDYPPLSANAVENYPPLISVEAYSKKIPNGVPPGLKKRPACDGMTFTNSAGQTFPAPLHTYIPPPDFENRNRSLVKKFAVALGGTGAVESFKVASRAFRDNIINADEFYQHLETALGDKLDELFPELIALLPDIAKQQELVIGREACNVLQVCSTCGQLLSPSDSIAHDTAHWPALAHK